jgi:hypothetical protein
MAGKNKGGREARKPKADANKKHKGQALPTSMPALDAVNHTGHQPKK